MKTRMLKSALRSVPFNNPSPDYGVGNEEKADKGNHCKGKSHVANQLSPNYLTEMSEHLFIFRKDCIPQIHICNKRQDYPVSFPLDVHECVSNRVAKTGRREVETLHAQFYRVHGKISVARARDQILEAIAILYFIVVFYWYFTL